MEADSAAYATVDETIRRGCLHHLDSVPMIRRIARTLLALIAIPTMGSAQVTIVSEPPGPSLLSGTRQLSRATALGDLRELTFAAADVELRVWGGYGRTRTQGIVIRRANGHWQAWLATFVTCSIQIPIPVGDTASPVTLRGYVAEARKHCGTSRGDVSGGAAVVTADTIAVEPLDTPESTIGSAWDAAINAGLLHLPARVNRTWEMDDGFTYVIEVRRGTEYRASEIEHLEKPEVSADAQVKRVYAAVSQVLRPEQRLRP